MTEAEGNAWQAFKSVVNNFLGNKRSSEYVFIVQQFDAEFKAPEASMYVSKYAFSKMTYGLFS